MMKLKTLDYLSPQNIKIMKPKATLKMNTARLSDGLQWLNRQNSAF